MIYRLLRLAAVVALFGVACEGNRGAAGQEPGYRGPVQAMQAHHTGAPVACRPPEYGNPDLFYNYYAGNNCGGVPASMYVAPYPVPATVGHSYYTYQPLMPHEFMYPHHRTYHRVYDNGRGIDRTSVMWYSNPVATVVKDIRCAVKLPR